MIKETPFHELFNSNSRKYFKVPFFIFKLYNKITGRNIHVVAKGGDMNIVEKLFWLYKNVYPLISKKKFIKRSVINYGSNCKNELSITLVGDLMLNPYLKNSKDKLYKDVEDLIFKSDLVLGNLEFVKSVDKNNSDDCGEGYKEGVTPPRHYTQNLSETLLFHKENKFSGVNLSNNHLMDYGEESLIETINYLKKNKINPIGVNSDQSNRISYFYFGSIEIAVVSFNFWSNYDNSLAKKYSNILDSINCKKITDEDLDIIKEQLKFCKKEQLIIVSLHFGLEFEFYTRKHLKENVKKIVKNFPQIDVIWGHHPHVIQPYEVYNINGKKIPVFYSVGNLTHPFTSLQCAISDVLKIYVNKTGKINSIEIIPVILEHNETEESLKLSEMSEDRLSEINKKYSK